MQACKTTPLAQLSPNTLRVWGRTSGSLSPLALFWTGSGIEVNAKASELWAEVETGFSLYEQWAAVLVNGELLTRLPLPAGRHWLCLFRGMSPDRVKNVRLVKEVQPMAMDPSSLLQVHALGADGELLPVKPLPRKIEFVGDSITSGEGLAGAQAEEDWISMFFSGVWGYPHLTAGLCGAEYRVVSQSGWGVLSGWDNTPMCAIPRIYAQLCGPLDTPQGQAGYDFASWQPDVVVVNLGTNDGGARCQPPWKDPASHASFQQTGDPAGQERFRAGAVEFLKLLRQKNPGAFLIWAYGMLGRDMASELREAVDAYKRQTGYQRAEFLLLPDTGAEAMGARRHPGKKAHARAAEVLADYIKTMWGD